MAQLPITSSQSQAATSSPQSGAQTLNDSTLSSSVQPGTVSSVLNGSGSVVLHPTALTSVNLNGSSPVTQTTAVSINTPKHHVNPVLIGFSAGLFVLAIVLFWITSRMGKNTI